MFSDVPKIIGVSSSSSSSGGSGTSVFVSIIVFAITVTSPTYVSNPALPITFIAFASFIFSIISCPSAKSFANDFIVIVPVPSYKSKISIPLPVLVSRTSQFKILPSNVTLPSFAAISFILIRFSFALDGFPIIYSCSSSISGIFTSSPSSGI